MFKQDFNYEAKKRVEKVQRWIAWHLPHSIVMWAYVRVVLHATNGKWGRTVIPDLSAMDALKRWDESNEGEPVDVFAKGLNTIQRVPQEAMRIPDADRTANPYKHTNSKGVTYFLNVKDVTLRGGKKTPIYYFSKDLRPEATMLPDHFYIRENPRNGFLTVARTEPNNESHSCDDDCCEED